ncbi:protein of unknown function DUF1345 [Gloeothece citriformis PCC 7424]|uniref:DUF1345 domain-containing protein n=1 Tax=Gloeothece citriformis (strain PCC 7424) TaxID=65393 RepID=B7KAL5_GLOC7|nr:DUF1345 domain-containing protein [Gloeothece citriformis]ACK68687.1 protein of unknown function DUF1345 [Gloeothece citriformis PCC 7424]
MLNKTTIFRLTQPLYRLIISLIVGIILYVFSKNFYLQIRLLLIYDVVILIYLFILTLRMLYATAEDTLYFSQREEPSNIFILTLVILLSLVTFMAVAIMLENEPDWNRALINLKIGLSLVAIFLSWVLVHVFFGLHYARLYYDQILEKNETGYRKGLDFPNKGLEDYWDFMYYSFTIAMCYQTSDVSISNNIIRRWTLVHSILSFLFVAVIVGLVVNAISNLV